MVERPEVAKSSAWKSDSETGSAGLVVVGQSVTRIDALEKVQGKARYYSDLKLPGMLEMKVLRSPYPHARVIDIDASEARRYPGVKCIVTGGDAPGQRFGIGLIKDQTVLATDVVRYVGEPVAAVAADTVEAAEEAAELIKVEYEELPAIFDPEEAMSQDPPVVVHPDFPDYEKAVFGPRLTPDRPNVFNHMMIRHGDVDEGFGQADLVLETRFFTPSFQHTPLETHGVIVRPEAGGGLTLWAGRQAQWTLRAILAEVFDIKASKIRIVQEYVGGAFGAKVKVPEVIAALMALKSGRPIRWIYTREEEFIDGGHREPMIIYIKDGVKKDGTLVARQIKAILNAGAYEDIISIVTRNCSFGSYPEYRTPNLKWDSYGVYTNEPPACAFRGFGVPEVNWAIESHMDMLAEWLGISPVEIRKRNILKEGEPNAVGELTHSIGTLECLDRVLEFIDPDEQRESEGLWRSGKGIAVGNKYSTGSAICGARVHVTEEEEIHIYHGADDMGQGCNTIMAQIAAEEFGISMDDVKVIFSDTTTAPFFADGSTSSRVTFQLGKAVRAASADARRKMFERAAEKLEVSPVDLETRGKEIYVKGSPDKKIRLGDLFEGSIGRPAVIHGGAAPDGEIIGVATNIQEYAWEDMATGQIDTAQAAQGKAINSFYTHLAKSVEVAVNVETGQVKVLRCCGATDLGRAMNPRMCEQQSESGLAMGIGDAIYEEMLMKRGVVINPNFTDYRIPSSNDMPTLENVKSFFTESTPHRDGPYGAKGFGEGAQIGMEAAICNAVRNAVGVRITDLPLSPEKVLKALKEKGGAELQRME